MSQPLTFDLNGLRVPKPAKQIAAGGHGGQRQIVVCPFAIVVDSREQLPWEFSGMVDHKTGDWLAVRTVVKGLASGDYSIEGFEDRIAIERKSLDDLYGSVTWGRERYEREIMRLDCMVATHREATEPRPSFAAVMIEATWPEICNPVEHRPGWVNRTDPRSVEGTVVAWSLRFQRVHWWAAGDRRGAEERTFSILRKFWQESHQG